MPSITVAGCPVVLLSSQPTLTRHWWCFCKWWSLWDGLLKQVHVDGDGSRDEREGDAWVELVDRYSTLRMAGGLMDMLPGDGAFVHFICLGWSVRSSERKIVGVVLQKIVSHSWWHHLWAVFYWRYLQTSEIDDWFKVLISSSCSSAAANMWID